MPSRWQLRRVAPRTPGATGQLLRYFPRRKGELRKVPMPATPDGLPDSERPSRRIRSAAAWIGRSAVVIAPVVLTGCQPGVLDPLGPIGTAEKQILIGSVAIILPIGAPTIAATFAFAWWFRASNTRASYLPDF